MRFTLPYQQIQHDLVAFDVLPILLGKCVSSPGEISIAIRDSDALDQAVVDCITSPLDKIFYRQGMNRSMNKVKVNRVNSQTIQRSMERFVKSSLGPAPQGWQKFGGNDYTLILFSIQVRVFVPLFYSVDAGFAGATAVTWWYSQ
jgi:hypothetical protein